MTSVTAPRSGSPLRRGGVPGGGGVRNTRPGRSASIMNCAPRGRYERSQINMPPVAAHGHALEPFRAVNNPIRPLIGDFWLQQGISTNAFLDLVGGQS